MQVVIDIDENLYTRLLDNGNIDAVDILKACVAIRKGTPLPEGHGDLIDRNKTKCSHCGKFGCENSDICATYHAQAIIKADGGDINVQRRSN